MEKAAEKLTLGSEKAPLLISHVVPHQPSQHNRRQRFFRACRVGFVALFVFFFLQYLTPEFISIDNDRSSWSFPDNTTTSSSTSTAIKKAFLPHQSWPHSDGLPYDQLTDILQHTPSVAHAREWSEYYTAGPHLAGKNLSQALWTKERWEEFGVEDTSIAAYEIYLNYPLDHRLALLKKKDNDDDDDAAEVSFEASLEEDVLGEDRTSGLSDRIPTFHGYSASGNVTAPFVYANFGTYADFEDLVKANVSLEGKIAIVKYGGVFRGLKVKRAQELGVVGVVMYSDPQEDGEITEENGYKAYPEGPARNPSAVQRGSTQFLSVAPGDPTTPGYPSKPGCERQDPQFAIPSIPSLPVSYKEILPFLKALNGHGPKASEFNEHWQGGKLGHKGVKYNIGPSPEDVVINLYNSQEYVTTPLWNVIGVIKGSIPDEVVVLGNHRDAWIAGGAADPNSGSAALNEVVRSFGEALKAGWKPLRTVVFASWDGEEYGLLGSTEWVEENLPWLSKANIAYLNVDVAASGSHFSPSASPLLNQVIYEVAEQVQSPNQTVKGQTIRDVWNGAISTMGSGSDFTAFQDFAGIPSLDFGFGRSSKDAVYHYHSNYDSFDWMDRFGDSNWLYHVTASKLWALTAAKLVETPVIAFSASDYAKGLLEYLDRIKPAAEKLPEGFSFAPLEVSMTKLRVVAEEFDAYAADLSSRLEEDLPWYLWWKKVQLLFQVRRVNDKYKNIERKFLYEPGLDGRSWFKHVVFAPGLWTGYAGATYPGLVESFEAGDLNNAEKWSIIIQDRIEDATKFLS